MTEENRKKRPLVIFAGLAVASLAGLGVASLNRQEPPTQQTATAEQKPMEVPKPAEPPAASSNEQTASVQPDAASAPEKPPGPAPSETPAAAQPAEPAPAETPLAQPETAPASEKPAEPSPATPQPVKPSFDTVRVEKSGDAVIAGKAAPGAEVTLMLDGQVIGKGKANAEGDFVLVPDKTLPPGTGSLSIESQTEPGGPMTSSEETVAIAVPEKPQDETMVAVVKPDAPTEVIQNKAAPQPETVTPKLEEPAATPEQPVSASEPPKADSEKVEAQPEQPSAPEPVPAKPGTAVSLDAVDYDDKGNIVFSGRGKPGSFVRIYVDNQPAGEAAVGPDNRWVFSGGSQISPGQHIFRVDEIDSSGKVTSRVELPFVREAPAKVTQQAQAETQSAQTQTAEAPPPAQPEQPPAAQPETQEQEAAAAQPEPKAEPIPAQKSGRIIIQPGNNLWKLSRVIYGKGTKYTVIFEANRDLIRNADLIYPGQIFRTPNMVPPEKISPKRKTPLAPGETAQ
jgi:nucleoid-associated protein YgaU